MPSLGNWFNDLPTIWCIKVIVMAMGAGAIFPLNIFAYARERRENLLLTILFAIYFRQLSSLFLCQEKKNYIINKKKNFLYVIVCGMWTTWRSCEGLVNGLNIKIFMIGTKWKMKQLNHMDITHLLLKIIYFTFHRDLKFYLETVFYFFRS